MASLALRLGLAGGLSALASASLSAPSRADDDKKDKKEKKDKSSDLRPMFDPEALERGAKALREINKSPYAKQVCVRVLRVFLWQGGRLAGGLSVAATTAAWPMLWKYIFTSYCHTGVAKEETCDGRLTAIHDLRSDICERDGDCT